MIRIIADFLTMTRDISRQKLLAFYYEKKNTDHESWRIDLNNWFQLPEMRVSLYSSKNTCKSENTFAYKCVLVNVSIPFY